MSNPDSPSCLLPSAKCGWGHAECSLLCRPDGSCKIEQFCLLKHQLFSKISISCLMAARLLLRERGRAGERCRLCSAAGATCQPRSCEKSLQHFQSCRKPALLLHTCAGHWGERLLQAPGALACSFHGSSQEPRGQTEFLPCHQVCRSLPES